MGMTLTTGRRRALGGEAKRWRISWEEYLILSRIFMFNLLFFLYFASVYTHLNERRHYFTFVWIWYLLLNLWSELWFLCKRNHSQSSEKVSKEQKTEENVMSIKRNKEERSIVISIRTIHVVYITWILLLCSVLTNMKGKDFQVTGRIYQNYDEKMIL